MQQTPKETTKQIRRKPWKIDEIAVLVRHRLLDYFPQHHDRLFSTLCRSVSEERFYLQVLLKRGPWDHFRHWVAVGWPVWKSFDWKSGAVLREMKQSALEDRPPWYSQTGQLSGAWGDEGDEGNPYVPPKPTLPQEELVRACAGADKNTYRVRSTWADAESTPSRPVRGDMPALNTAVESFRLPLQFYLRVEPEDKRDTFGHLYSYIYLSEQALDGHSEDMVPDALRDVWPPILQAGKETLSDDFAIIREQYKERLGLPETYFNVVLGEYWWGKASTLMGRGEHKVSPAARLACFLEAVQPQVYRRYYDLVRTLRRRVLMLPPISKTPDWTPELDDELTREYRNQLQDDPLFNCVFHREAYHGQSDLHFARLHPGPEGAIEEKWATRAAVDGFQDLFERGGPMRVTAFFRDVKGLSRHMRKLVDCIEGASAADYVSPLLSAIYHPGRIVAPVAVRSTYSRKPGRPAGGTALSA